LSHRVRTELVVARAQESEPASTGHSGLSGELLLLVFVGTKGFQ
jgi:hypothetical protein